MPTESWSANAKWTSEQILNARTIIRVGQEVGATKRDIAIALITAIQESALKNISGGDRDSAGLFQQRPSMGWGSWSQVTDPEYAARTFYMGKPGNPGLFSIKNRDQLSMTEAAQKVQRSAFPDAYARHESAAFKLLGMDPGAADEVKAPAPKLPTPQRGGMQAPPPRSNKGIVKPPAAPPTPLPLQSTQAVLKPAMDDAVSTSTAEPALGAGIDAVGGPAGIAGVGGTGIGDVTDTASQGIADIFAPMPELPEVDKDTFTSALYSTPAPQPTFGADGAMAAGAGADIVSLAMTYQGTPYVWGGNSYNGVDCSGLVQQVYRAKGIELPRLSADQARAGARIGLDQLQPGDLVGWDNSSRNNGADHIAIYIGNGQIIEAPRPGLAVRVRKLDDYDAGAWGVRLSAAGA